jgi:hypothetical protein
LILQFEQPKLRDTGPAVNLFAGTSIDRARKRVEHLHDQFWNSPEIRVLDVIFPRPAEKEIVRLDGVGFGQGDIDAADAGPSA